MTHDKKIRRYCCALISWVDIISTCSDLLAVRKAFLVPDADLVELKVMGTLFTLQPWTSYQTIIALQTKGVSPPDSRSRLISDNPALSKQAANFF